MDLLTKKLSSLAPGSHVRLTHPSGRIIEGVVAENDGKEALSIQITSLATLRYDQICLMEESQQIAGIQPEIHIPSPEPVSLVKPITEKKITAMGVMKINCDQEAVAQAFKSMEPEEKKVLTQAYDKFQSYLKSHDEDKCKEAINLVWDRIEKYKWDYNPRVCLFLGLMQLAYGEYVNAAESFFYAKNTRYAYCAAYQGFDNDDKKIYMLAATFAAIYLISDDPGEKIEAAEVLQQSSVKAMDISGIECALKNAQSDDIKELLSDIIRGIGAEHVTNSSELADMEELLSRVRLIYPKVKIQKKIAYYLDDTVVSKNTGTSEKSDTVENAENSDKASAADDSVSALTAVSGTEPDTTKEYTGCIKTYNYFEYNGTIETDSGEKYPFDIKDIADISLQKQVKKIMSKTFEPIPVRFMLSKQVIKYIAVSVKRGSVPVNVLITKANTLFSHKNYTGAVEIYKKILDTSEWETGFVHIIHCYLSMIKDNDELGYLDELRAFVEKYEDKISKNIKNLEALMQYYMKVQNYTAAINSLNELVELCDSSESGKMLHYMGVKARCYRFLKDYPSAISELLGWIDLVKRDKLTDRQVQRDTFIYIELAEMYYEDGDYENADKYVNLAADSERKQMLLRKIETKKAELAYDDYMSDYDDDDDDFEDVTDGVMSEPEESLQTAYESYTDTAGFDSMGLEYNYIINTALSFTPDQIHSMLTYMHSAAMLCESSKMECVTENGETTYVAHAVKVVDAALSYAFNSPLLGSEYHSTEIIAIFEEAQKFLPDIAPSLLAASAMYATFNTPSIPDYNIDDFSVLIEDSNLHQNAAVLSLVNDLASFRNQTGYGMDAFASYKTGSSVIEAIINEANECCNAIDMRNVVYETQGQVRRTREFIFSNEKSELRICLNIVAENKTDRYLFVKNIIADLFICSGKSVTIDNLDIKKLDKYIDRYWDLARDVILDEGRSVKRPHDKIKGGKRTNIIVTIRRILCCICDWLAVAEHSGHSENVFFAQLKYDELAPKVIAELSDIIKVCEQNIVENGFDWGTESIRRAAVELLEKMNGTYSNKSRRYFFIDFLRGEDVLLDENYLPETHSTFCNMPDFNILHRIERHASNPHIELHEHLTEILSNNEAKHNFRTARLIRAYGEDMGIHEITEHKDIVQYGECLKQAKQRFETLYQNFSDELELCESYGTLSNLNNEKDEIMAIAYGWYRISRVTNDFGFYVRLLEVIRNRISVNAEKKGEQLRRQLEELADKPEYNFGIFSKEMIEEKINDQNYTAAEFTMSCILRGDVSAISDYSDEPFGYFKEFVSEHATNYRAVSGAGRDIADTIFEYSGKKDLEKALMYLTNNSHKETKGGANLLKSWIPRGGPASTEQLEKLLIRLGFKPESITPDKSIDTEAYQVFCRKQIGKVNYVHQIPAFGSKSEQEGFRILCLYGRYGCDTLMDKFREVNATAKNTLVLLDFAMNMEERRRLARKIKEEKSFAKTFIVIDRVILFYLAKHYAENTVIRRLLSVTLPFAYYQPFVESSILDMPPELFTGREAELTSIESPDGASLVYGGRQLGKSVLLKMAKHNIDKNGNGDRAVLIDIRDRTAAESAKIVCNQLIIEDVLDESCRCDTWTALAEHLQRRLMDNDPQTRINYLLLMLDEADVFIQTSIDSEDQPITALKNLPSDRFKLVMAGLHNLSRYNRQSIHGNSNLIHLTPIVIKQFRREEATKLLTSILAYLGFRFTQNIIDNILASTYNYPGLIQFYCQKLLEAMKNDDYAGYTESGTPYYEVTESHYKRVLADTAFTDKVNEKLESTLFTEEKVRSNYHIIALIIAYLCYITPNDKGYTSDNLLNIAKEYHINRITSLSSEQFSEILNEMCDLNIVTVMENYYRFSTDGFRRLLGSQENVEKSMSMYFEEVMSS